MSFKKLRAWSQLVTCPCRSIRSFNCQTLKVWKRNFVDSLVAPAQDVFAKLAELGATRIQWRSCSRQRPDRKALFLNIYNKLFLADKKVLKSLATSVTLRDVYADLVKLPVDAIGLDFVEGKLLNSLKVTSSWQRLFAWYCQWWRNSYELGDSWANPAENIVLTSSCCASSCAIYSTMKIFWTSYLEPLCFCSWKIGWDPWLGCYPQRSKRVQLLRKQRTLCDWACW